MRQTPGRPEVPRTPRRKRKRPAPGSAPGTLVPAADLPGATVHRILFGPDCYEEADLHPGELARALEVPPGCCVWLDVQGLGEAAALRRLGELLGLHPLTVEDIVHTHQRPKVETFDGYLFVTLRAVRLLPDGTVDNEQLSLVVRDGLVVSFQERPGDGFDPLRRRLREGVGLLRRGGAGLLASGLLDAVIDDYFPVIEAYGDTMDALDDEVRERPTRRTAAAVHAMRRELRLFRRAVWPLRETIGALERVAPDRFGPEARLALRDCHDHVVQAVDFVESNRERASDLADLYLAAVGERTNQVMKVLTIIATIFIPLTFVCGVYGMNFHTEASPWNMPELSWKYGYPFFWLVSLAVAVTMVWIFRRRGWLGGDSGGKHGR